MEIWEIMSILEIGRLELGDLEKLGDLEIGRFRDWRLK